MSMLLRGLAVAEDRASLEGSAMYLRSPRSSDWSAWAKVRAESRSFLTPWEPSWPADALTRAAFRRRLRRYARDQREDRGYAFFIFRKSDSALLGGVTLTSVRRGIVQSCSVGYWIGRRYARQGHMTDALGTVVAFVFDELGLRRIEAACLTNNEASKALLDRVGFTQEGYAREYLCINGVWSDHLLYALLAADVK